MELTKILSLRCLVKRAPVLSHSPFSRHRKVKTKNKGNDQDISPTPHPQNQKGKKAHSQNKPAPDQQA